MKQTETASFLAMIKTAYPFFEVTEPGVRLWHMMLTNLDYKTAQNRLANHIRSSKFAPSISEIVNPIADEERSFYELQRAEEEADKLALEEYNEKAIPMPEHIRERIERFAAQRRVNRHES
ncbi:replicative helicase loader/inhibitor [Paenibacillus dokdonensis]|uniref:Replicative helicase loader/inhibitor n=1 Tax=Paenibacillus dokdonensis TaxID=2567944 RepID=A0ABU6GI73_9BACL|nr:replicative helicase loader/inhibitor [Paenibacillus dokdonensis]MEC0239461.1 replicative helicase loader/inhibitor [Paenibacillus dokdonensis]